MSTVSPGSGCGRVLGWSCPLGAVLGRCAGLGRLLLVRPATGVAAGWWLAGEEVRSPTARRFSSPPGL